MVRGIYRFTPWILGLCLSLGGVLAWAITSRDAEFQLLLQQPEDTIPGAVGSDTGNAVGNENKVRIEIPDADLRMRDERHVE